MRYALPFEKVLSQRCCDLETDSEGLTRCSKLHTHLSLMHSGACFLIYFSFDPTDCVYVVCCGVLLALQFVSTRLWIGSGGRGWDVENW
jgi:hypothetical protein